LARCAPISEYDRAYDQYIVEHNFFRLSIDGKVLLIAVNRAGDITMQDDVALCVADLRKFEFYGKVRDAVPVQIGPFSDVYYSDSGVIVVSATVSSTTNLLVWSSIDDLLAAQYASAKEMSLEAPGNGIPFNSLWGATFMDCVHPDSSEPHFLVVIENSMWPAPNQTNRARFHAFKPLTGTPTEWPKSTRPIEIDAPFFSWYTYFTDMDPVWFTKHHDPTCTWITDAVGHYNLNASALFHEVPPLLGDSTTSIDARHQEQPFKDSLGLECDVLVRAFPIDSDGHAIGLRNQEMMILDYTDNFAIQRYIPNYVLFTPFAVTGVETVAIVQPDSNFFWSPTGLGSRIILDRPRFGGFHLPSPKYLIPDLKGSNLFSFADDGLAMWTPTYSVSSRSPIVTSNYPCNTDYQLPFLSHTATWTAYICVTNTEDVPVEFSFKEVLLVNVKASQTPMPLEKLIGSEQLFEWVEFETTKSSWLAVWSQVDFNTSRTLIVDIYCLQSTTPTLTQKLQKHTNRPIQVKEDRLVCGNWLLFQDCLVYVRDDGSVLSNCSVDLSRLLRQETCTEDCTEYPLARVQFTDKCDRLLIVSWPCPCINNPTPLAAVISLSENGTASEEYVITQHSSIETSVLMLSVLPSFTFEHGPDCQYTNYVLSPNGRFLGTVCSRISDSGIDIVVRLFNLSSSSSSLPIWTLATEGPLTYYDEVAFLKNPQLLSFSPDSQYMALQKRNALAVYDLTRPNFTSDPLVLSTKLASIDQMIRAITRAFSYPFFTVDSMFLCSFEFYANNYAALEATVYAVHPRAHTASLCKVAGRDLTAAEWLEVGLGDKDHPICPGPFYDGATCFGVPYGQHITVGIPMYSVDTCILDSYAFAVQFTFTAEVDGRHEVNVGSEYVPYPFSLCHPTPPHSTLSCLLIVYVPVLVCFHFCIGPAFWGGSLGLGRMFEPVGRTKHPPLPGLKGVMQSQCIFNKGKGHISS